jgi:hypothetical protein
MSIRIGILEVPIVRIIDEGVVVVGVDSVPGALFAGLPGFGDDLDVEA